ncbi:MAG TPA: efflux RND transporter periplasmic adaptor subunit [Ohtaekwangia sp.]|nr:efflux RND transporter periplasmic adaptor subunit [Ohtaekwangia sp.]
MKKSPNIQINVPMKSTVYHQLSVFAIAVVLAACSAASPDEKEAKLEKLKGQQADIAKQIEQLEAEIAKTNPDSAEVKVRMKDVAVLEVKAVKFDHFVKTQGRVEAENNIAVTAKAPGVVSQVFVQEGQQVSKGQVLAQTDNSILVRSIEAQRTQLELATAVYNRQKNLWDQKIGTEVQFLQAKTNKESLEKTLASLEEQNDQTRIKSPISGTVDEVIAKIGEAVSPGQPAFRVVNVSDLKLTASVSEAYVTDIKKGDKVLVNIPELKEEFESRVTFVGKTIDPLSRTFNVEVKLTPKPSLRPNMTGIIRVVYHTEPAAITVPINIVQDLNNEKIVYVAEAKGKQTVARKKVVNVEGVFDGRAQVSGLSAGDKVITVGYQGLNDGDFVKI